MLDAAGKDNMFIFGLNAAEVEELWLSGYRSSDYYVKNPYLRRIVDYLATGFAGESFSDLASYLLSGHGIADPFMCLADFESYQLTHDEMIRAYADKDRWNRMSLLNIAGAGHFAADRAVREYADRIWHLTPLDGKNRKDNLK